MTGLIVGLNIYMSPPLKPSHPGCGGNYLVIRIKSKIPVSCTFLGRTTKRG